MSSTAASPGRVALAARSLEQRGDVEEAERRLAEGLENNGGLFMFQQRVEAANSATHRLSESASARDLRKARRDVNEAMDAATACTPLIVGCYEGCVEEGQPEHAPRRCTYTVPSSDRGIQPVS